MLIGLGARVRYPCNGSIGIRFSTVKGALTFRYTHHAVHSPPREVKVQTGAERVEGDRGLVAAGVVPGAIGGKGQDAGRMVGGWRGEVDVGEGRVGGGGLDG